MKSQKVLNYCPSLNAITGSITASLLMCQLEYWFDKTKGASFYKFLEPCEHSHYKKKDSWTEELGFSKAEFRHAFNKIGKVYKSKSAYRNSKNPFEGKLYLSYYDRHTKLTYYIRNTDAITTLLRSQKCKLPYSRDYKSSKSHSLLQENKKEIDKTMPQKVLSLFAQYCPSLKHTSQLTTKYTQQLNGLLSMLVQKGLDVWSTFEQVFKLVEASDFLCGRLPHSTWHAALSWILRPDKFFAILAGKYAPFSSCNTFSTSTPTASASTSTSDALPSTSVRQPLPLQPAPTSRFSRFIHSFNRVESHNFDLAELEAKERAYQERMYMETVQY